MNNRILIITGNRLRHKYYALKILSYYENASLIIENQPKTPWGSHVSDPSDTIKAHFIEFNKTEEIFFSDFVNNNKNLFEKRKILEIENGEINNINIIEKIVKINPILICTLSTSILKNQFIASFPKNSIINYHAGLSPYYRGSGTNIFPFYNDELEYIGITLHYIDTGIDSGDIVLQGRPNFEKNDNTHTIGCKNVILGAELMIKIIDSYIKKGAPKGIRQDLSKGKFYYKKDFNENIIITVNNMINNGLINRYIERQLVNIDIIEEMKYE